MKKSTLNFGEFRQYDKVFITADNGIDVENVSSVAFAGETLYIAQPDGLVEFKDGVLLVCPGALQNGEYAVLEIKGEKVRVELKSLSSEDV